MSAQGLKKIVVASVLTIPLCFLLYHGLLLKNYKDLKNVINTAGPQIRIKLWEWSRGKDDILPFREIKILSREASS